MNPPKKGKTKRELLQEVESFQARQKPPDQPVAADESFPRLAGLYITIIETMLEGALVILANGTIIYCNKQFAEMVKKPVPHVIGSRIFDFIPASHMAAFQEAFEKGRKQSTKCEVQLKVGRDTLPVLFSFSAVRGSTGNSLVATAIDLTEQKEKEILQERLNRAEKLEAIGTLAAGIAHDLNNTLAPVLVNTDMALLDLPPGDPYRRYLTSTRASVLRARELVQQIVTFAARKDGEKKLIPIGPAVKECLDLLRSTIPKNIEIADALRDGFLTVQASPSQIHQIIINLFNNASYAMREKGGKLSVEVSRVELNEPRAVIDGILPPGSYIRLAVSDTGTGMPPRIMERIFDPFFTTKAVGEGSGMGLPVVFGTVKSLRGGIEVHSRVGLGTTFEIFLPVAQGEEEKESAPAGSIIGGNERILFIDDEEVLLSAHEAVLTRLGYKVTAVSNGVQALEIFRSHPREFDLVITDEKMPSLTGTELAGRILQIRGDIPIILLTGYAEGGIEQMAKSRGIQETIMKPLSMRELAETVRRVLDHPAKTASSRKGLESKLRSGSLH